MATKPRSFLYGGFHKRSFRKRGCHVRIVRIPCEVYSRIVGYLRPVQNWNTGKVQEWKERRVYEVPQ